MKIQLSAYLIALSLAAAGTAAAQDADPALPPAPPEKAPEDPGNWRPKSPEAPLLPPAPEETPPPPLPPTAEDPTALPPAPGEALPPAAPKPAPKKELSPQEKAQRDQKISKNYADAERTLREVLENDTADYETADTRVKNLRNIVRTYYQRRVDYEAQRRRLNVNSFNRKLYYQKQFKAGKIPEKVYLEKLKEEEQRIKREKTQLDSQIKFALDEENRARTTLAEQEAKLNMLKVTQGPKVKAKIEKAKPKKPVDPAQQLRERLRRLGAFKPKGSLGDSRLDGSP